VKEIQRLLGFLPTGYTAFASAFSKANRNFAMEALIFSFPPMKWAKWAVAGLRFQVGPKAIEPVLPTQINVHDVRLYLKAMDVRQPESLRIS
jgi:hypothetical protein